MHVQVEPFWLGKYEVTWNEFEPFMITTFERYKNGGVRILIRPLTLLSTR